MKFSDFFVPRWQHSNPEVRKAAIARIDDAKLLLQISEKDEDAGVRELASQRLVAFRENV